MPPAAARRLRLGIDARDLLVAEPTGVERVVAEFIAEAVRTDLGADIVLFSDRPLGRRAPGGHYELALVPAGSPLLRRFFDFWISFGLRRALRERRIDAFLSLNTKFPLLGVAAFATVHGVEWAFHPQGYRRAERARQWLWFQLSARRAAGIVCFARNTENDIRKLHPGCSRPVRVVPEGVAAAFHPAAPRATDAALLQRLGIRGPYLLSVCSLVPRKNLDGLLRAFALLPAEGRPQLLLVGRAGWRAEALRDLVAQLDIGRDVVFAGYLPEDELIALYRQARVFVYPSKYEGFGLPPLEAMACGVPVVTADRSATAEIGRGAAVLVNPDSDRDMADGLSRALHDEDLRRELIAAGFERSRGYTWAAMAAGIIGFIRERLSAGTK